MRSTILLCDYAEAPNGKLYVMGGGFTRIRSDIPVVTVAAVLVHVPYDQTNRKHTFAVRLLTEDGHPYPAQNPVVTEGDFEVGRPPGMRLGEESNVPIVSRLNNVVFDAGGYRWEAEINGEIIATAPFTALSDL